MLKTQNKNWGFWGTACQQAGDAFAEKAWAIAFEHVETWMGWGEILTRDFLDSRNGRHYADIMSGSHNFRDALTQYQHLESLCRVFYKEVDPLGYSLWCKNNGKSPTDRVLKATKVSTDDILRVVNNLTGLNHSEYEIKEAIKEAAPIAQALALILSDIPEEIRGMYTSDDR